MEDGRGGREAGGQVDGIPGGRCGSVSLDDREMGGKDERPGSSEGLSGD